MIISDSSKFEVIRNKQPDVPVSYPFELMHIDLAGPNNPVAKDGLKYIISFTDYFSGCLFTYLFFERKI